jgi:hypothetical protein
VTRHLHPAQQRHAFGLRVAFRPVTWLQLAPNQFRTSSSYFANIRNDWKPDINISVFKQFLIRERIMVEFRGEVF